MSPIIRRILQLLLIVTIQAIFLFASAWTFNWSAGWLYIGLYVAMLTIASLFLLPSRAEVVAERSRGTEGGRPWDLMITRLMMIPSMGLLIVAGLDERFNFTGPLPLWARWLGGFLFVGGYAMVVWAMYSNKYFSQVVRIQTERGHEAVTKGPYRIVRHPGYLGMLVSVFGAVFLLDSLWCLACFALYLLLIVIRTTLEDRTLLAELPGYAEFAARTKYRLLPGVW